MPECWIGLGANLGDARGAFESAWSLLHAHPQIEMLRRSGLYRTVPVGANAGPSFLNAVCGVETTLAPIELLDLLQSIELSLGRTRTLHWGPRTLDLDLLFFGDRVVLEPRLTVPHPAAWHRRFVLDPLLEVTPKLRCTGLSALGHPEWSGSLQDIHSGLKQRPLSLGYPTHWSRQVEALRSAVTFRFADMTLEILSEKLESPVLCLRPIDEAGVRGKLLQLSVPELDPTRPEAAQTLIDFLTAAIDEPERVGDW